MTPETRATDALPVNALSDMLMAWPPQAAAAAPLRALAAPVAESGAGPWKPVKRVMLLDAVQTRSTANLVGTMRLLSAQTDPDKAKSILEDIFDMQSAFMDQSWQLGRNWCQGLQQICLDWFSSREANTLSKATERDYNVAGQLGALIADQVTQTVTLIERANVGYGYWLSQKLGQSSS